MTEDDPGLLKYKKKWSSKIILTYQYFYPNPGIQQEDRGLEPRELNGLKQKIWQKLPLRLIGFISKILYRYL